MNWWTDFEFLHKNVLYALLLLPLLAFWWKISVKKKYASFKISSTEALSEDSFINKLFSLLPFLRLSAIGLLILVLARPQSVSNKGIDIALVLDTSRSMLDKDIAPDRITAMKSVVSDFIKSRKSDRISLIGYAGEAATLVPLTTNYEKLIEETEKITVGIFDKGTAIGLGLGVAVNRLRKSKAKSRIIILLTDGINGKGIDPLDAAALAEYEKIKVYTIGLGSLEKKSNNLFDFSFINRHQLNEDLLKEIAKKTQGKYYRASDKDQLKTIYFEIEKLEKSEIRSKRLSTYKERYRWFLIPALLLLVLEFVIRKTLFKGIT